LKPNAVTSVAEAQTKLEYYCSYQERCHDEVETKLRELGMIPEAREKIIIHLIQNNFLNETRFACSFARGKQRIKHWGKIRIVNELKFRHISKYNIDLALKEFSEDEYLTTFHSLAERQWENVREKNTIKKRKKFCDFMLRKGFESNLIYEKVKDFESSTSSD
jgi:regulatory protein